MELQQSINMHTAKVVSALISNGFYPWDHYQIDRRSGYCSIKLTGVRVSPFSKLIIYPDGIIHYLQGDEVRFEGSTKNKKSIMSDIIHK